MEKNTDKYIIIDEIPNLDSVVFEGEIDLYKDTLCKLIFQLTSDLSAGNLAEDARVELKSRGGNSS